MHGPPAIPSRHRSLVAALHAASRVELAEAGLGFLDLRENESWSSFGALLDRAAHVARSLLARGVRPGDRVALIAPTCPELVDALFGVLLAGAVAVPLYPPVRLGRLDEYHRATARMLDASSARLVLADAQVRRLLGRTIARVRPELGCLALDEVARDPRTSIPLPSVEGHDLAIIQFSSGSTVDPKPVALSHDNVLAQCAALEKIFPTHGEDGAPLRGRTGVSWLPLYHDMGLVGALLTSVFVPGRLLLIPPEHFLARPALWLRAISRHRALVSPAPNFAYSYVERRVREDELMGVDLACWKLALDGAEPVASSVIARFVARFAAHGFQASALRPVYGLAEATLAVTFPRRPLRTVMHQGRSVVSVGEPIPGVSVAIRAADGRLLGDGEVGRIHVRGPSVMTGYYRRADETAKTIVDGWLDTGDLGFVDDGELFVCGREKDVVVVRGQNHAAHAFEEPLDEVEGVRTGCAIAVGFTPPDGEGEWLVLLVEATPDAPPDLDSRIRAAVLERTGVYPSIVRVLAPGTLPRTSSGKLRRSEALRRFETDTLDAPDRATPLLVAKELVRSTLAFAGTRLFDEREEGL